MDATGLSQWDFLEVPPAAATALASISEPVRQWFTHQFGLPTSGQRLAWPAIKAAHNLLLAAPTGSGKTLAAFLPILDQLSADPGNGTLRCLYLTPLKALGNDIKRNLRRYLRGLREYLPQGRRTIHVGLRTGDTSQRLRQKLQREPPDILLTTPESLGVLLTQGWSETLFAGLRWVIVDEIHALYPNKRGADLTLSLERLELLTRPLQRIGLSATCGRPSEVANFLVGSGRNCAVAVVQDSAPLEIKIEPLFGDEKKDGHRRSGWGGPNAFIPSLGDFMTRLVERLTPELAANQTTVIFTNVRNLAERLAWALRRRFPTWTEQIGVHHSALAASRRRWVERRLKQGKLRAVISSTSLELGIDIGQVDGVVLVHPPGGVVRLLQRLGRCGHKPGGPRRGLVLTSTSAELLEAAVTGAAGRAGQCEAPALPEHPLDVLCQQLLGLAAQGAWTKEESFALVKKAYPYRYLINDDFKACLNYLSGLGPDGQPWLPARLRWHGDRFTIKDRQTTRLLRMNLGTIITEETRQVQLLDKSAPVQNSEPGPSQFLYPDFELKALNHSAVGQVDQAFADRLNPGDRFLLDGRCLELRRDDGATLLVEEVFGKPAAPRWGGDGWPLSAELANRLYLLRVRAAEALRDGPHSLTGLLMGEYHLEQPAAAALVSFFQQQESLSEIPDAATLLIEALRGISGENYYFHTPLNRAANDALARVVVHRLVRDRGWTALSTVADLGFMIHLRQPRSLASDDWRELLSPTIFDADLKQAMDGSISLRGRFRQTALIGLMLLRRPLGQPRKVGGQEWAQRRLFEQIRAVQRDFVLLRQAEREIREQCCDEERARAFLQVDLPSKAIRVRRLQHLSPFAESWTQPASGPMEIAETSAEALTRLHALLMARPPA